MALIENLDNNITGLSFRTITNNNFATLNNEKAEKSVTNDHETRLTALEGETFTPSVVSMTTTTQKATQVLTPNVAEKLDWASNKLVESGSVITGDTLTSTFTINETGIYRIGGIITFNAPINNLVDIELRINNLPTGFISTGIGRDLSNFVTLTYNVLTPFTVGDDITLWVTSDGDKVIVASASITIEKTIY